jgi:dTDP-4-dehydrorhamnose reductase
MILVTGASGLLGSNIVTFLQGEKEDITAIYYANPIKFNNVRCIKTDITHEKLLKNLFSELNPEVIIHCAAQTDVDWCEKYPSKAYSINVDATRFIAEAAKESDSTLVYISTDSVFNGKLGNYQEEDIPDPVNVYAKSKLDGESEIIKLTRKYLILRTNIYGWNLQEKLSLNEWFLQKLESGQTVSAFDDVLFSPILVNDLAKIIYDMIKARLTGLYHAGSSESCSKFEFACKLSDIFSLDKNLIMPVTIDSIPLVARRPKNMSLNTQKIHAALNRDMPDIISGLVKLKLLKDTGYVRKLKNNQGAG